MMEAGTVIETKADRATDLRLAMDEPDRRWELVDGRLREKPGMAFRHNWTGRKLGHFLLLQLDSKRFQVRVDAGRVRKPESTSSIPDVFVLPLEFGNPFRDRDDLLEVDDAPLPLVVEVWSRSTGDDDVEEKLADDQRRGDAEIRRLHPFEKTLTRWVRRADGGDEETLHHGGVVRLAVLPDVAIDLDALLAD